MARILARVGKYDVISTQSMIYYKDENIIIHPFDDDDNYNIDVRILFHDDPASNGSSIKFENRATPLLEIKTVFQNATRVLNPERIIIARDEDYNYSLVYSFSFVGPPTHYAVIFDYTIYRNSIDG